MPKHWLTLATYHYQYIIIHPSPVIHFSNKFSSAWLLNIVAPRQSVFLFLHPHHLIVINGH